MVGSSSLLIIKKLGRWSEISQYIFPASSDFVFFINCSLTMIWSMAVAVSVVILVGTVIVGIKFCSSTVSKKFLTLSFKFIFRPSMFRSPRMMHIFLSSFIFCSVVSTWLVKWFRHSMVPPGCLYITPITNFLLGCVFRHVSNQMFSISNSCPLICLLSIAKSSLASILMLLLYMSPTPPLALLGVFLRHGDRRLRTASCLIWPKTPLQTKAKHTKWYKRENHHHRA